MARGVFSTSNYFLYSGGLITATPLTMACWSYSLSYAVDYAYLMSITSTNAGPDGWGLMVSSSRAVYARVWAAGSYSQSYIQTINAGTWQHAAAVFASTTSRIAYLDGISGAEETTSRVPATAVSRSMLGTFIYGAGTIYKPQTEGYIAEVGFWNVALTAPEILQLAAGYSPLFVRPESLVAYYPLIRGDSSGDEPDLMAGAKMVEQGTVPIATHARVFYPVAPIFRWDNRTVFPCILSGSLTPTGALIIQTQKVLAGSITPTGALIKQTQKILTGTLTLSGTLVNQTQKVLAGTLTIAGTLVIQTQKVLIGSLTLSGILVNQTQKILAGTLNMSGVLLKQTQKILVGSLTPTGTLIKQTQKVLAGTLTSFGTLVAVFIPPAIAVAANEMFKSMWNGITKRMRGH